MKKLLNCLFLISSATVLLTSCKKEELTKTNETPKTLENATTQRGTGGLVAAPSYTLIKRDKDSLIYYNDGRLAKVLHGSMTYTQYNYGFNTVIAKTFTGNQLDKEITYEIDVQTGRVYESHSTAYSYYAGGNIVTQKRHKYEYDAEGHLKKKYNKYKTYERTNFNWGPNGDLATIYFHDEYNDILYKIVFTHIAYANKVKLRSDRSGLDPYLDIFGKGSKDMIGKEQLYKLGDNSPFVAEQFTYLLNADGYPTSCTVKDVITNKRINGFYYNYSVSK